MAMPELVRGEQLTDEGRKVIALVTSTLDQAESLVEGQDVTSLNALSGPFQDYWVNVRKAHLHTPESWLKDRPYAAFHLWTLIQEQEQAAAKEQKTETLETRLAKLEEQMIKALETIQTKDAEIAALKADAGPAVEKTQGFLPDEKPIGSVVNGIGEPIKTTSTRKGKKTEEPEPESPAAEPAAEGEPEAEV